MERLELNGYAVNLQVLDNEASAAYKLDITETWGYKFGRALPQHS